MVSKSNNEENNAYEAWCEFKELTNKLCGQSLSSIFGGLPQEFHKYRTVVPKPIDWVNPLFEGKVIQGCVKADICSAYGNEASKPLPDLHENCRKIVNGKVEPSQEYPFAFYLESNEMAVWGEGSSADLKNTRYMRETAYEAINERTLLCKAASITLRPVFEYLYAHRKENEMLKFVMNATIGMFHRKKFTGVQDNLWPLAAVIKFRCNKRIISLCETLVSLGQIPLLINTDSITWKGNDMSLVVFDKALGNFRLEFEDCKLLYKGPKKYQVSGIPYGETEPVVMTRWAGPHNSTYTHNLAFGALLDKDILQRITAEEQNNVFRWNKERHRFITLAGEVFTLKEVIE